MTQPTVRRAVLIAPGSEERKARKALASSADEVVLDLEDAVSAASKDSARELVAELLREFGSTRAVSVRINAIGTRWADDDLAMCAQSGALMRSIVIPKVTSPADLVTASRRAPGIGLQALIETPDGLQAADAICRATPTVESIILGYADLGAALGRSPVSRPEHWLATQDRVVIAARAAGIAAIDGPFIGIADDGPFQDAARWAADLGFDGKWVIHPAQITTATTIFTPSPASVRDAQLILKTLAEAEMRGAGAVQLDGMMLDEAVAVRARRVLAKASR